MLATLNFQCLKSEEKIPNFTTQGNSIQTSYREIIETYGTKRNTKNMYKKLHIQNCSSWASFTKLCICSL